MARRSYYVRRSLSSSTVALENASFGCTHLRLLANRTKCWHRKLTAHLHAAVPTMEVACEYGYIVILTFCAESSFRPTETELAQQVSRCNNLTDEWPSPMSAIGEKASAVLTAGACSRRRRDIPVME